MSSTKRNPADYDVLSPFSRGGACDYCHSRKIRCDKHKPQCHECIKRKVTCNYGKRLKRGPKTKTKPQRNDQIQIAPRSNSHLQAMLFELEFNRKLAELWRNMLSKIGEGAVRPPPKFEPATEEFIRAQGAVETLMEDFDTTHRLIYNLHDFATSLDFASKLWQTIIEINADDLIAVISSFETSMLISMLEYIVVFQLCTKIYMLDDIAAYISKIIRCIINIVVFARDGTNDSLTPELTLKLLSSLTLTSNYFKATLDKNAIVSYHLMIQDLYEQNKSSPLFGKELEARMLCRRILSCLTKEASDMCMQRLHELDEEGIMSPNLHFHLNNHLAYFGLRHQVLNDANQAIQKAEYFIKWHLDEIPQDKRPALENFYKTRLSAIHVEILLRMGHTESALQRVGQMYNAFSQLPTAFRRLCTANCNFFMVTMRHKGPFLSEEYISLLVNPTAMVNHVLFPALTRSVVKQGSNVTLQCTTEAVDEPIDIIESSESSPQNDTLTLDTFSWQGIDESPEATWVFTSSDQLFFDNAQLEPSDFISENNV